MDKVISILYEASNVINTSLDYSEFCYQTYIMTRMQQENIYVNREVICNFVVNKIRFGWGKIDILVRGEHEIVIIELKANVKGLYRAEKQVQRYMKHFDSNLPKVGLVFMFNSSDRQSMIKRIIK